MKRHLFFLLPLFAFAEPVFAQKPRTTVVEGTVIDRPYSKALLLSKAEEDMRLHPPQEIPIVAGRFRFRLEARPDEAHSLTFADEWERHAWRPTVFFPDADTVRLTLYPMKTADRNRVAGGADNRELRYIDSVFTYATPEFRALDSLRDAQEDNDTYYSPEANALRAQLDRKPSPLVRDSLRRLWDVLQRSDRLLTPEAAATERQIKAYLDSIEQARYDYIRNYPSPAGYYWLYRTQLFSPLESRALRKEIYRTVYAPLYPHHPYTARLDTVFCRQVAVGHPFADFEAPDLDGRMHRLSELVAGRIALVDLWASWCGPCRRNSMAVIPVYNEFRDRGFTVVGVARETGDTRAMRKAVARDGYPWPNLVELNDRAGIWQLYGIIRGAGGQFLIDRDGTVLAIDPTAKELRKILAEKLH